MHIFRTLNHWKSGVRFYIALAVIAFTLQTVWWASVNYSGTNQFATHIEEVFGWVALAMISLAVSIGPFFKLFPTVAGKRIWFEARRLIGVGGGWFATLHTIIVYRAQFSFANPLTLPPIYQLSFLFGGIALLILLAMVATSFDKAFKAMGIWWFRLHRFVYIALLAVLMHVFLIGVHATQKPVLILLSIVAAIIVLLHVASQKGRPTKWQLVSLTLAAVALALVFDYGFTHIRNSDSIKGNYASNG